MKYLVVNADDFGACAGVNRGIMEAHRRGIVTSASLMVGMPGSEEAARLARKCPALSVGLHVQFGDGRRGPVANLADTAACRESLCAQLVRFTGLMGRPPTHLDSHHHVHTRPELLPHFKEMAELHGAPLRECSGVRYCSRFYGQWAGEHHPERVSVSDLIQILATDVGEGVTELGCHPGCADPALASSYRIERQLELSTLCDGRVRGFLDDRGIALIGFREVPRLACTTTQGDFSS
jgi:chitin disaccharide deacetylase